ncbi:SDR family oxidoreductase [Microbacterium sp. 10M-3C3]|jgi:NAD(P)-dependent dehydrogenase (short-subunit alcohol dehydrogenase family)|uniref:SDR family NAD(P)-dependent oxidoreductase n=1 Tax=Microbacterium sp. 10M-3C3 TaxID=2483401 RepID=UPI000F62E943|nr:SDR family oxidoreductase [Microbacterium sp. 10M-3C3]
MSNRFEGRFAAVTGAASGNGRAIAEKLLADGATLAAIDLNPDALESVFGDRPEILQVQADVADQQSVKAGFEQIADAFGRLDILVNNAGIVKFGTFEELSQAEWDQVFAVNSTGPFLVSQAAYPLLRAGDADHTRAIVNITSVEAHIVISSSGHPQIHYNASKGALLQLTRALAVEAAAAGIRVNAVAPGFIETPFTAEALAKDEVRDWLLERTPLGRIGKPEDVANGVAFLASDEASWITGSTLFVDGGWTVY